MCPGGSPHYANGVSPPHSALEVHSITPAAFLLLILPWRFTPLPQRGVKSLAGPSLCESHCRGNLRLSRRHLCTRTLVGELFLSRGGILDGTPAGAFFLCRWGIGSTWRFVPLRQWRFSSSLYPGGSLHYPSGVSFVSRRVVNHSRPRSFETLSDT